MTFIPHQINVMGERVGACQWSIRELYSGWTPIYCGLTPQSEAWMTEHYGFSWWWPPVPELRGVPLSDCPCWLLPWLERRDA